MFELVRAIALDGDRARGVAEVPAGLAALADHFPGQPVVPGTWLIELCAQIAGPLAEAAAPGRWAVLAMIRHAKLLAPVAVPATLAIEATRGRRDGDLVTARIAARCGEVAVVRGELAFALVEAPAGAASAIAERAARLARWQAAW
jgi:3-hydroxymyristoyl/3-hydroxydecanoyl-(acyl carrier protein) dehydratase